MFVCLCVSEDVILIVSECKYKCECMFVNSSDFV